MTKRQKISTIARKTEFSPDFVETSSTSKRTGQGVTVVENPYYDGQQVATNQYRRTNSRKGESSTIKHESLVSPDIIETHSTLKRFGQGLAVVENPYYGENLLNERR